MTLTQRARMIGRFLIRQSESDYKTIEHQLCKRVTVALAYGASVRTINSMSKSYRTRCESWFARPIGDRPL